MMEKTSGTVYSTILFVIAFYALISLSFGDDQSTSEFYVSPGGQRNTFQSKEWHGITCQFTYVCQGGTKEKWQMSIKRDDDFEYKCVVQCPETHPSYLFFQEFQVDVTGAGLKDAQVYGADLDNSLDSKEFEINKEKHIVKSSSKFQASLNRVEVSLIRKKGIKDDL